MLESALPWNGIALFRDISWSKSPSLQLFTDTPGVGFGGLYNTARFYGTWSAHQSDGPFRSIIWRELYPIAIALSLWGEQWAHHAAQCQQTDYFNSAHHLRQTLLIKAGDLIRDSVAPSSARTYLPGTRAYSKLCTQLGCQPSSPSVNDLLEFITHCVSGHRSSATIRVYVSAVKYYLLCHGGPSHITRHDRVTAALEGEERQQWQHRQQAAPTQGQRQAITQSDLQQLLTPVIQRSHYCESDRCMLWAAFMTAFAGLLRVSEDTAASPRSASNGCTLTLGQVSLTGTQISIRLGITKTSQRGTGGQVILQPWSGSQLCPVQAMRKYLTIRHATQTMSPLFIF